jgi:hypothetical protein
MSELFKFECVSCGISCGFPDSVKTVWFKTGKTFFCPNGHAQSYLLDKGPTPEQMELEALRNETKELSVKLTTALNQVKELSLELEIYKPAEMKNHYE